jgi:thiol-disulfide isomerase/thioredoxin
MNNNQKPQAKEITFYHAVWCPHCVVMQPEWKKFKESVGGSIIVKEVEESSMSKEDANKIQGFPSIKITDTNNNVYDYNGKRNSRDLKDHVQNFSAYYIEGRAPQNGGGQAGGFSSTSSPSKEKYYEMKYYKYKAKLAKLNESRK